MEINPIGEEDRDTIHPLSAHPVIAAYLEQLANLAPEHVNIVVDTKILAAVNRTWEGIQESLLQQNGQNIKNSRLAAEKMAAIQSANQAHKGNALSNYKNPFYFLLRNAFEMER